MEVSLQAFRKRFTYDPQKDLLGKGGFGDVYKAYDNEDHIYVALKIAHASADDKHNLINEIKRFKKLNHPNIIKHIEAYEVNTGGFDIHGRPIINHVGVLEYADNGTLADLLKQQSGAGLQNPQRLRNIIEDLANDIIDGLAYLHSQNIIHRDLKPTNILLFSEGDKLRAKITDFGIAKKADATAASTQLVGTVEYMAPEYFTTGNITKASDIWSLGVMLLEALSGTHPFGKTTQGLSNEQIIRNILSKDLQENLVNAPPKELLTRCLLREANLRPQSAEELKGLMLSSGDAFTERTQIISTKKKVSENEGSKPKWKRLITALFDFDVRNGRWRKVLAREAIITLPFLPVLLYQIIFYHDSFVHDGYGIIAGILFMRYVVAGFLWALKTLEFTFPTISDRISRAIKYLVIIGLVLIFLSASIYLVYQQINSNQLANNSNGIDYKSLPPPSTTNKATPILTPKEKFNPNDFEVIDPDFSPTKSEKIAAKKKEETLDIKKEQKEKGNAEITLQTQQKQQPVPIENSNWKNTPGLYAQIETDKGNIVLRLEFQKTPRTVGNFVALAEGKMANNAKAAGAPYFDGLSFHRCIPQFMIQGGCPQGNGSGGPGYQFEDEIESSLSHDGPGVLSMANVGPGTNGSQFFITHVATPWLDGKHTVFGKIVEGLKVVNSINNGDVMKRVSIIRFGDEAKRFDGLKAFMSWRK